MLVNHFQHQAFWFAFCVPARKDNRKTLAFVFDKYLVYTTLLSEDQPNSKSFQEIVDATNMWAYGQVNKCDSFHLLLINIYVPLN